MRLQRYITEDNVKNLDYLDFDKVIDFIQKRCKPFLQEIRGCRSRTLIRGKRDLNVDKFAKVKRRENRLPMNMSPDYMRFLDDVFQDVFGWRPRSTGVFSEFSKAIKSGYGTPYLLFPIGNFRYLYSNDIADFYLDDAMKSPVMYHPRKNEITFNDKIVRAMYSDLELEELSKKEVMKRWVKKAFKNKNICRAKNDHEIMFDCDYYYLVHSDYYQEIQQRLW